MQDIFITSKSVVAKMRTNRVYMGTFLLLNGINLLLVRHMTIRHPFLDADNRHYAQKYYKYVIMSPTLKYYMVPLYSYMMLHSYEIATHNSVFLFIFTLCSAMALVLTPLFEFRYFVIPWVLFTLETKQNSSYRKNMALYFAIVNAAVLYIFVEKPFVNIYFNGELSRFFW